MDLALRNPKIKHYEPTDPMLRIAGLRAAAKSWALPHDFESEKINPIFESGHSFPPILFAQGKYDIFYEDTVNFANRLKEENADITLIKEPDGFHVYPGVIWSSEAKHFFNEVGNFVGRVTKTNN